MRDRNGFRTDRIKAMFLAGTESPFAIGRALGIKPDTVSNILARLGLREKEPHSPVWSEEIVEQLKSLHAEGLSASRIAAVLGNGITRNAVIGQLTRRGLSGGGMPRKVLSPSATQNQADRRITFARPPSSGGLKSAPLRAEAAAPVAPLVLEDGSHVTLMQIRDGMCRFPIGDPCHPDFHFCGQKPWTGSIYCAGHHVLCFVPAQQRRARSDDVEAA